MVKAVKGKDNKGKDRTAKVVNLDNKAKDNPEAVSRAIASNRPAIRVQPVPAAAQQNLLWIFSAVSKAIAPLAHRQVNPADSQAVKASKVLSAADHQRRRPQF